MPKERAPVVGPSQPCQFCLRPTSQATDGLCSQCWSLRQILTAYVPLLLADPVVAPKVVALLHAAADGAANHEPSKGVA